MTGPGHNPYLGSESVSGLSLASNVDCRGSSPSPYGACSMEHITYCFKICVLTVHVFQQNFSLCASVGTRFYPLLSNGPFQVRYGGNCEDSLKMAPVMCRNMLKNY